MAKEKKYEYLKSKNQEKVCWNLFIFEIRICWVEMIVKGF